MTSNNDSVVPFHTASAMFTLDERTGRLTTRVAATGGPEQAQHNLLIIARDHGDDPSSRVSSCPVTVVIAYAPIFSSLYYTIPFMQENGKNENKKIAAGHKITQVKAVAAGTANEARLIRYAILHASRNEISVDSSTGIVRAERELLLRPGELVKVQITATDSRDARVSDRPATVLLFSAVFHDNFQFENSSGFHFSVKENSLSDFGKFRSLGFLLQFASEK